MYGQVKVYDDLVKIGDVKCALRGNKQGAPGPDRVSYHHVKQVSDAELSYLLMDFSVIFKYSESQRKEGYIVI